MQIIFVYLLKIKFLCTHGLESQIAQKDRKQEENKSPPPNHPMVVNVHLSHGFFHQIVCTVPIFYILIALLLRRDCTMHSVLNCFCNLESRGLFI